jgi:CBS domain-containing protein
MKVGELMEKDVITCGDAARLGEIAKLMWEHDLGFIPVISSENGVFAGVITDRDGFLTAYFQGKDLWNIPVRSAMSTHIATCPPEADVEEAQQLMRESQVHRLPVVTKEGKLIGVVTLNDFARKAAHEENEKLGEQVAITLGAISEPRSSNAPPQPRAGPMGPRETSWATARPA